MIAVIVVMIAKVLPVFSQIYAELGSELTGTAAVLMKLSEYINRYLLIIIAFMLNRIQPFCKLHVFSTLKRARHRPWS